MLQIEDLLHRLPKQLSGGQKQRVALGRAMARNPSVFLMDEPLSNLDAKLRTETRAQIVNLQRKLGITAIYVTHDQVEAMTMGDRIAVIHAGQIQQIAPPLELYNHPANQYVAGFIGSPPMNFLPVQVAAPTTLALPLQRRIVHNQVSITLPDTWTTTLAPYTGQTVILGIRPEHLHAQNQSDAAFRTTVQRVEALGNETYVTTQMVDVRSPNLSLQIRLSPDVSVQLGNELWLGVAVDRVHLFDKDTGLAITS
jgi:multiple sugar transport system ATP-binding protein